MVTKMVIAIILACFGCMMMVNGLIGWSIDGFGDVGSMISIGGGFLLLIVFSRLSRTSGLVDNMREETQKGLGYIHESAISVVAIVVALWCFSYAFIHGSLDKTSGILMAAGFILIITGFRHLRKTGWFQQLQEEAK